jgi:hypothetical protein
MYRPATFSTSTVIGCALASGGIGAMHRLAQHTGLIDALDRHVEMLKVALPYHE